MAGNGEQHEMEQEPTTEEPENDFNARPEKMEEGSLIKAGCDDEGKIFVGGLSWDTEREGLKEYFSQFGEVKDCCIKRDSNSNRSRGFGFVLFDSPESVKKVLEHQDHTLDSRKIDPKKAKALKKEKKLFAGGFSPNLTDEQLNAYFSKFGEIELLERPTGKTPDKPRGFCFITYRTDEGMSKACQQKIHTLEGKDFEVKKADQHRDRGRGRGHGYGFNPNYYPTWNSQPWPPQSMSGGFGDYNYGPSQYGNYGGYGYGPSGGGYGQGQPSGYGNYYQDYGNYGYGGGYGPGQFQTQSPLGAGKTIRRGGQNNFKPY